MTPLIELLISNFFIKNLKTTEFKRVFNIFQNISLSLDPLNNNNINNNLNTISMETFPEIPISKVGMWIPREDKKTNKDKDILV